MAEESLPEGVLTGIRQLRRVRPLEIEEIAGLQVPTLAEMARIKAWMLATRDTTRDYLDTVVLFERLGEDKVREALSSLDEIYPQSNGASVLSEVTERLGEAKPADAAEIDLAAYRGLQPPWNDWSYLASRGRSWAQVLARFLFEGKDRFDLSTSQALWNRSYLDLESDEVLAQILDRGELEAWREVYRLASGPGEEAARLRHRILRLCQTVPLSFPHLFIAAMGALGEPIEPYPQVPPPADDLA